MNVTFRQLRIFIEVARFGSMARAADALHLTPPAVSMQVKELEAQVGLPLLERVGRAVRLSQSGEQFLVHAKRLLAELKDAEHAMARLRKLEDGVLTIGVVSTAKYFVPHLLTRFHAQHPGVEVRLAVAQNREGLVELMQEGEADLAIMGRPPREMATIAQPFAKHPLVFVAPAGHPLDRSPPAPAPARNKRVRGATAGAAMGGRIEAAALAAYPLIAREPASGTRAAMDRYFAEHRATPRITMEMPSNETIKQAVIAGMGLSFLSLHTIGLELRNGLLKILDVEGTPLIREWNIVHLGSKVLSPAAEAFRDFILKSGDDYLSAHDALWLRSGIDPPRLKAASSSNRQRRAAR